MSKPFSNKVKSNDRLVGFKGIICRFEPGGCGKRVEFAIKGEVISGLAAQLMSASKGAKIHIETACSEFAFPGKLEAMPWTAFVVFCESIMWSALTDFLIKMIASGCSNVGFSPYMREKEDES